MCFFFIIIYLFCTGFVFQEQENRELLDQFRMMHSQAEEWEAKAQNAAGESSSVKMELLSIDTDRRHLRERVEDLENEVREVRAPPILELGSSAKNSFPAGFN